MPNSEQEKQEQLDILRRRLHHLKVQQAQFGAYTPPHVAIEIEDTYAEIARLEGVTGRIPWNVPFLPNELFVGRDDELARLAAMLDEKPGAIIISGLGGVGKTQLAVEMAHRCAGDPATWPGGVLWVAMQQPEQVRNAIAAAGETLDIPGYDGLSLDEKIKAVVREWAAPTRRLLIFDNCESRALLNEWNPPAGSGARVLVTARATNWPRTTTRRLELSHLPRPSACTLLVSHRALELDVPADTLANAPDADRICHHLGDLALALHMAAAYLGERVGVSLARYLEQIAHNPLDHASLQALSDDLPTAHLAHVAHTFAPSYALLEDAPHARLLLNLLSHGVPGTPVPRTLARRAAAAHADALDEEQTGAALARLRQVGLITYAGEESVVLHPLVSAYVRQQQHTPDADADAVAQALVGMTNDMHEEGKLLPAQMTPILPHARAAADAAEQRGSEHAAGLLNNLGYYLQHALADFAGARALYERALAIDEATYGPDHPNVAIRVNNLGMVAQAMGDRPAARALYERALAIFEQHLGESHPNVATLVNNLGMVAQDMGDLPAARALLERALAIDEATYGPDHPNVAIRVNNLGMVAKAMGDLPAARALLERALAIDEATYGPDHPEVAIDVNNLGMVAQAMGDRPAARALYERALAIDEATYGPDHPNVARDVNNLGMVAQAMGDRPAARALLERALAIFEQHLGESHPNVATLVNNLGMVAQDMGDRPAARALFERALAIDEATYGPDHPNVAIRVNNLGHLEQAEGNRDAARACFERALRIFQHFLGEEHPHTQTVRRNLEGVNIADSR